MEKDFYNIDFALSEEERAVRDSIRSFVDDKVIPIIGDAYIEGKFPRQIIPEMDGAPVAGRIRSGDRPWQGVPAQGPIRRCCSACNATRRVTP